MDELKPFAALRVTGADRVPFLQGQLSNDLRQLQRDRPLLAGWCNPQGRLLCTLWVIDWLESVWLVLPTELAHSVAKRLQLFVLRSQVHIEKANAATELLLLAENQDHLKSENNNLTRCYYDDKSYTLPVCSGAAIRLQNTPTAPCDGLLQARWLLQLIRAGIPVIWTRTSGEFVPQMVNLDLLGGISFTKGCYVGQEIVARTQNLGRIKRHMYAYRSLTSHDPQPGEPVFAGPDIAGQIVSCTRSSEHCELLAVIKLDCVGLLLSLGADGRDALEPMHLPYLVQDN